MSGQESEAKGTLGSKEAEELFLRHYPRVLSYFRRRGLSEEDSRDLTQETFLRLYKSFGSFRGESSELTWIFLVAANVLKNTVRHQSTQKRLGEVAPFSEDVYALPTPKVDVLEAAIAEEQVRHLREALNELPLQRRQIVLLRVDSELKYREIAVLMNISIETVKAHLHQAREHLRARLADLLRAPDVVEACTEVLKGSGG